MGMTPEEKALIYARLGELHEAVDLVSSAIKALAQQVQDVALPLSSYRECEWCDERVDDDTSFCSEQCAQESMLARERSMHQSEWTLQRPDDAPDECLPFCEEHETCREHARLYTAQRLGFAWTREQQELREELLNSPYPEYTVIVEHVETAEGSGDRARIPVMGLSEWIARDDDHGWYFDPYTWAKQAIAGHLGVSRNDFDVQVIRPAAPAPVKDQRPVYKDPHANPEDDVLRRIGWLEDEADQTAGYTMRRIVTDNGHGVIWSGSVPETVRHRQDIGARQARETVTALFDGADIEEVY